MSRKRQNGQFFTDLNPFRHPAFSWWVDRSELLDRPILEPFAGANGLIRHLEDMEYCHASVSYDIEPQDERVEVRDTLANFPTGFDVCVTNPPWLARNSATVRGLAYPDCEHDNLYKFALQKCLENCGWVAALIPESFIRADLYQDRLAEFVSIPHKLFADTDHPVGLALFTPGPIEDVQVWFGTERIGWLSDLESARPTPMSGGADVTFNESNGNVGLIALDNTYEPSIRFCDVKELADYEVKRTGRHITKLGVSGYVRIKRWNDYLADFREATRDVLLTCYKGIRKDGMYRRRLDWEIARGIIHHA